MKFHFSIEADGELDGNDASQEHFTGHRLSSVAKEIGQNTNDARSEVARDKNEPAIVSFEKVQVATNQIPDIETLKEKLNGCLKYAKEQLEDDDLTLFYERAIKLVSQKNIPVLRVCDWNTRGLEGPFEGASPVVAFAKGKGISKKDSKFSGGSRGMGKNAIFTISSLRTSFFSTLSLNKKTDNLEYLSQGKAVLTSDYSEGVIKKGTGYCGEQNAKAVVGEENIPDWLKRSNHIPHEAVDKRGLSLFALGFDQGPDWHLKLAASAISTFFSAIQQGILEFRVIDGDQKLIINRDSYFSFFEKPEVISTLDSEEKIEFKRANIYAQILEDAEAEDPSVYVEHFQNPKVGNFRLCIKVDEKLPRKVALIRTGMLITEAMPNLQRFAGKDFAAVLQARSEDGMAFLRNLEGAEHNALQPDRIDDKKEQRKARQTLIEITKRARELIEKHITIEVEDTDDIDELAQFFPYDVGEGGEDKEKNELNPLGRLLLVPKQVTKKKVKIRPPKTGDEGGDGPGPFGGKPGQGGGGNGQHGGGSGDKPVAQRIPVGISNIRAPLISEDKTKRRICFTADSSGSLELALYIAGADEDDAISVKKASSGEVADGNILFSDVKKGERFATDVELSNSFGGAIKAFAFQTIQLEEDAK